VNLLIDTNVLSEVQRPAPNLKVLGWLDAVDEDRTFISVASIAELRRGVALMSDGRRRAALRSGIARTASREAFSPASREAVEPPRTSHGLKMAARSAEVLAAAR
jgi:predicted nucleic acid-binding protein